MTDYQAGRVSAVHSVGEHVEILAEASEAEAKTLDSVRAGLVMASAALNTYRASLIKELQDAKVPIKEAEYGKTYVNRCIDIVNKLVNDADVKRCHAQGAAMALQQAVAGIKKLHDEESHKLEQHKAYEASPAQDIKQRPIGADPGNPIASMKIEKNSTKQQAKRRNR